MQAVAASGSKSDSSANEPLGLYSKKVRCSVRLQHYVLTYSSTSKGAICDGLAMAQGQGAMMHGESDGWFTFVAGYSSYLLHDTEGKSGKKRKSLATIVLFHFLSIVGSFKEPMHCTVCR
jgi:oxalate decarboxylase/phosphoglucose isomerase-like protein (cupin superfamily)